MRLLNLWIALALFPCWAVAQVDPAPAKSNQQKPFDLDSLTYDPTLCGTTHYGYYWGNKNRGHLTFTVAPAPEESAAAYRVRLETTVRMGLLKTVLLEEVDLDASLALVRSKTSTDRSGTKSSRTIEPLKPGTWTVTGVAAGKRASVACDLKGKDRSSYASQLLIARKLGPTCSTRLDSVMWPTEETLTFSDGLSWSGQVDTFDVKSGAFAPLLHRGRKVNARAVTVAALTVQIDEAGNVVSYRDGPGLWLSGTEEESRRDTKGVEGPAEQACRELMQTYTRVACGEAPAAALKGLVDWELQRVAHPLPGATSATYPRLASAQIAAAAKQAVLGAEQYGDMIMVGKEGDVVMGAFYGAFWDTTFCFRKDATGWKITRMPLHAPWGPGPSKQ